MAYVDVTQECSGLHPSPRSYHSCTFVPTRSEVYIIGGTDGRQLLDDVHRLRVGTNVATETTVMRSPRPSNQYMWEQVEMKVSGSRNMLTPRARHSAVYINGAIYCFGGLGGGNSVFLLDLKKLRWIRLKSTGQAPCARFGHCAVVIRHFMFIIGGHNGSRALNDVYRFCSVTRRWSQISVLSAVHPPPSLNYTACKVGEEVVMFGGSVGAPLTHFWILKRPTGSLENEYSSTSSSGSYLDQRQNAYEWAKVSLNTSGLHLNQRVKKEAPLVTLSQACFASATPIARAALGISNRTIYFIEGSLGETLPQSGEYDLGMATGSIWSVAVPVDRSGCIITKRAEESGKGGFGSAIDHFMWARRRLLGDIPVVKVGVSITAISSGTDQLTLFWFGGTISLNDLVRYQEQQKVGFAVESKEMVPPSKYKASGPRSPLLAVDDGESSSSDSDTDSDHDGLTMLRYIEDEKRLDYPLRDRYQSTGSHQESGGNQQKPFPSPVWQYNPSSPYENAHGPVPNILGVEAFQKSSTTSRYDKDNDGVDQRHTGDPSSFHLYGSRTDTFKMQSQMGLNSFMEGDRDNDLTGLQSAYEELKKEGKNDRYFTCNVHILDMNARMQWQVLEARSKPPQARYGHSMTYISKMDSVLVLGGDVEGLTIWDAHLLSFDKSSKSWSWVFPPMDIDVPEKEMDGNNPPKHPEALSIVVKQGNTAVGVATRSFEEEEHEGGPRNLKLPSPLPISVSPKGGTRKAVQRKDIVVPPPLTSHSSTYFPHLDRLFVFGGGDLDNLSDSLWVLHMNQDVWYWERATPKMNPVNSAKKAMKILGAEAHDRVVENLRWPGARAGHAAVAVNDFLVILGGGGPKGVAMSDVWRLNVNLDGKDPNETRMFKSTSAMMRELEVLEEQQEEPKRSNPRDLYKDLQWDLLKIHKPHGIDQVPDPRLGHSCVVVDSMERLYMFGGCLNGDQSIGHARRGGEGVNQPANNLILELSDDFYSISLKSKHLRWTRLNQGVSGRGPTPRYGHIMVAIGEKQTQVGMSTFSLSNRPSLCVYGGFGYEINGNRGSMVGPFRLNDVYIFDITFSSWTKPAVEMADLRVPRPPKRGRENEQPSMIGVNVNTSNHKEMEFDQYKVPTPRFRHAVCAVPHSQRVLIFGGTQGDEPDANTVLELCTDIFSTYTAAMNHTIDETKYV